MTIVSTAATITPRFDRFDVHMHPDNAPWNPAQPIGSIKWLGGVTVAAKITTDTSELALSFAHLPNYAVRLTNVSIQVGGSAADISADLDDWGDQGILTIPSLDQTVQLVLNKQTTSSSVNLTNPMAFSIYLPNQGLGYDRPMVMASAMIFRTVDSTGSATIAMPFTSQVEGYVYTLEQYAKGQMHIPVAVPGASPGTGDLQ